MTNQQMVVPENETGPIKMTEERMLRIFRAVRAGATRELAAQCGRISSHTLRAWLKSGSEGHPFYLDFYNRFMDAEEDCFLISLEKIQEDKAWQSKAWLLERRYPEAYGRHLADAAQRTEKQTIKITYLNDWRKRVEIELTSEKTEQIQGNSIPVTSDLTEINESPEKVVQISANSSESIDS